MNKIDRILRPNEAKENSAQQLVLVLDNFQSLLEALNNQFKQLEARVLVLEEKIRHE